MYNPLWILILPLKWIFSYSIFSIGRNHEYIIINCLVICGWLSVLIVSVLTLTLFIVSGSGGGDSNSSMNNDDGKKGKERIDTESSRFDISSSSLELDRGRDNVVDASSFAQDVYKCGWMYISPMYEWPVGMDLVLLQQMKNEPTYRRPRDVFFVVLKHRALCLYESEEQRVCLLYIILDGSVKIEVYPAYIAPEEHYYKDHPLRLYSWNKPILGQTVYEIFMWMPNGLEKEDWLFAIRNAGGTSDYSTQIYINQMYKPYMEGLHEKLESCHSNDRWFNALIGRIFFNVFQSQETKDQIISKISRKLEFIKRPYLLVKNYSNFRVL